MTQRVLSGMRPTGNLHLGHLCGVLENWKQLQAHAECFFFVADFHALTTDYESPANTAAMSRELVATWLSAGIDGSRATLFVQSDIPEHAELHVLLSMICPLPKLMQLPTYKEQKENLQRNLDTYGFLGYPLLQSADILAYRPTGVPVGDDQRPHVEFTRELARRFNYFYGRTPAFEKRIATILKSLGDAQQKQIAAAKKAYQQNGDEDSLNEVLANVGAPLDDESQKQLRSYCFCDSEELLPSPDCLLTHTPRLAGTDGRKMSKSYDNTIELFESPELVAQKLKTMQTDPARIRRTDKGDPKNCPVGELHRSFSDDETQAWAFEGCRTAGIGCIECKQKMAAVINDKLAPLHARRAQVDASGEAEAVLQEGRKRARAEAGATLAIVRECMGLPAAPR